ncbi:MAG: hypothetical protein ACT6RU_14525 [Aliihoeflea sp.]|uniref:hypothetical protein n=1 Tax=Aliihoeflea sp. TaxID=2608088 RepID=UPI0040343602
MSAKAVAFGIVLAIVLHQPIARSANQAATDGPVAGFASGVPLELAVYQIVPPQVAVEISAVVDRKLKVSWRGGPSWRRSLAAMLSPAGLAAVEGAAGMLWIGPADQAPAGPATAMPNQPLVAPVASVAVQQPPAVAPRPVASPASAAAADPAATDNRMTLCARAGEEDPRPIGRWRVWSARQGSDLRSALASWVDAIKQDLGDPELFDLAWHARGLRYPLKATIRCEGYFTDAVPYLLSGWADVPARPIGTLYTNTLAISAVGGSDVPVDE